MPNPPWPRARAVISNGLRTGLSPLLGVTGLIGRFGPPDSGSSPLPKSPGSLGLFSDAPLERTSGASF